MPAYDPLLTPEKLQTSYQQLSDMLHKECADAVVTLLFYAHYDNIPALPETNKAKCLAVVESVAVLTAALKGALEEVERYFYVPRSCVVEEGETMLVTAKLNKAGEVRLPEYVQTKEGDLFFD